MDESEDKSAGGREERSAEPYLPGISFFVSTSGGFLKSVSVGHDTVSKQLTPLFGRGETVEQWNRMLVRYVVKPNAIVDIYL